MAATSSSSQRDRFADYIWDFEKADDIIEGKPIEKFTDQEIADIKERLETEEANAERRKPRLVGISREGW